MSLLPDREFRRCVGRTQARDDFRRVLRGGDAALLLIDSERPIPDNAGPWVFLAPEGWQQPAGATGDHVHFMVQCMESWFLADRAALQKYFGNGFRENALPQNTQPEQVPKADILTGLDSAARGTQKNGYRKGRDSFRILADLNPGQVRTACPWARRLLEALETGA